MTATAATTTAEFSKSFAPITSIWNQSHKKSKFCKTLQRYEVKGSPLFLFNW